MTKKLLQFDISRIGDDKALAIGAYGEAVSAYRYIVLAEKAPEVRLRGSFETMVQSENAQRDAIHNLLQELFPATNFLLTPQDKELVCVGPRLVDARDDARFDEAMKLVIASEKRSISFYGRYAAAARHPKVKDLFTKLTAEGLDRVRLLRQLFHDAGKQITESCPIQ
jgi:rubrerythrin